MGLKERVKEIKEKIKRICISLVPQIDCSIVSSENCRVWRIGREVKRLYDSMSVDDCEISEDNVIVVEFKGALGWRIHEEDNSKSEQ